MTSNAPPAPPAAPLADSTAIAALTDAVAWNEAGLAPAIAQDSATGRVLMMAWMNREALAETLKRGEAVYYSRSRSRLWHKGESSGHTQRVERVQLDCDGDALLLHVQQSGGIACHTGRLSCFYREPQGASWQEVEPVLKSAASIYGGGTRDEH